MQENLQNKARLSTADKLLVSHAISDLAGCSQVAFRLLKIGLTNDVSRRLSSES